MERRYSLGPVFLSAPLHPSIHPPCGIFDGAKGIFVLGALLTNEKIRIEKKKKNSIELVRPGPSIGHMVPDEDEPNEGKARR
jgi:hypothetical protein